MLKIKWLVFFIVVNIITTNSFASCDFSSVTFGTDFSSAHLDSCKELNDQSYLLTIKPENFPINNSPWYAFKVMSKEKQTISIAIEYIQGEHRYKPKISRDGQNWSSLPHRLKNKQLTFRLEVTEEPVWIAAQELVTNDFYQNWLEAIAKQSDYHLSILGNSTEQRPIYQLESKAKSNEWVVIVGRMHPPEVTGALALFPFSQELLFNKKMGRSFRDRFNILLIPNMNPDGVEYGYWRSNVKGVDLNRDWVLLEQKETQLVHQKLQSIVSDGGKIVFGIDFHSTQKDVFYTMPTDYGMKPAMLVEQWLNDIAEKAPDFKVRVKPGSRPGKGIFKQYIADTYGVQAITYEMADEGDRQQIRKVAKIAANTFMEKLLETPKEAF